MDKIEIRCPIGPRRLFMKMLSDGETPQRTQGNLIELACADCKKTLLRDHNVKCSRVLHRYDLAGNLVQTVLEL